MRDGDVRVEYETVSDELDAAEEGSGRFESALAHMEELAERGSVDAAETVAELYCFSRVHRDAERAYRWYFRALSAQGYTTALQDLNHTPPHYRGLAGDFRNEAAVNGLVEQLGFDRVRELDNELARTRWIPR